MRYRIPLLIICVVATLPAYAERYSSGGEAFFVGALQGLFLMLIFWGWRLIKGGKSKTKETQSQDRAKTISAQTTDNTTSKVIQPSFSPWEKYKKDNADIAKDVESLIEGDLHYLSRKDILEKIATFKRVSKRFNCPISELKKYNSEYILLKI